MDYYGMQAMRRTMGLFGASAEEKAEALSPALKELSFSVMVTASFGLEGAK